MLLQVVAHSSQMIYTRMIGDAPEDEKENEGGVVVSLTVVQDILKSVPLPGGEERKGKEGQGRGKSIGKG